MNLLDRRFLNISLSVQCIANSPADNPNTGTQYIVGEAGSGPFYGIPQNYIARYNGSLWEFYAPKIDGLELLNLSTGEFLRYDGLNWISVFSISENTSAASIQRTTEVHSLTEQEATAKSFSLSHSIANGQENNILCFVCGVAQAVGIDFEASGNSICWRDKGLDYIGLTEGDIFIINYLMA